MVKCNLAGTVLTLIKAVPNFKTSCALFTEQFTSLVDDMCYMIDLDA